MQDPTPTALQPPSAPSTIGGSDGVTNIPQLSQGYELDREIARGGMGIVYRARDVAMGREVAVKVLLDKFPLDGPAARRFVEEARITGQLQHPGIPPIHLIGRQPDGRPFLAMKLIKGRTLDDLLKSREPVNVLAVFEAIAQAVGYAHAHGVVHRDLKPANVMVGGFGEVQVMDWGLAKVLGQREMASGSRDETLGTEIRSLRDSHDETHAGSVLGTPAFMPPEQAIGAIDEVDAQSDVFGLGAILCVMLTGRPPYVGSDAESTRKLAARGKLDEALAALDACAAEPELIAMCKRCLSVEKSNRPADGNAVATEVAALRAAAAERAKQAEIDKSTAIARRRVLAWAASAVVTVLSVGIAGSLALWDRAETAEAATASELANTKAAKLRAEMEERNARAAERDAKTRAEAERLANEQTRRRLQQIEILSMTMFQLFADFDVKALRLSPEDFIKSYGNNLAAAGKKIDPKLIDDAFLLAEIYEQLGQALSSMYRRPDAIHFLRLAYDLRLRTLGADDKLTLQTMYRLADCYRWEGQTAEGLRLMTERVRIIVGQTGDTSDKAIAAKMDLAEFSTWAGQTAAAAAVYKELLASHRAKFGLRNAKTVQIMDKLALVLFYLDQRDEAVALYEEALPAAQAVYGKHDYRTLGILNCLSSFHNQLGHARKALQYSELWYKGTAANYGEQSTLASGALARVGNHRIAVGEVEAGERDLEQAYRDSRPWRIKGSDFAVSNIGIELLNHYRTTRAEGKAMAIFESEFEIVRARHVGETLEFANDLAKLGNLVLELEMHEAALRALRPCLTIRERLDPTGWSTFNTRALVGAALLGRRDFENARPLLVSGFEGMTKLRETVAPEYRNQMRRAGCWLIELYTATNRPDRAAEIRAQLPREIAPRPRSSHASTSRDESSRQMRTE